MEKAWGVSSYFAALGVFPDASGTHANSSDERLPAGRQVSRKAIFALADKDAGDTHIRPVRKSPGCSVVVARVLREDLARVRLSAARPQQNRQPHGWRFCCGVG